MHWFRRIQNSLRLLVVVATLAAWAKDLRAADIQFGRDIRPVLADNCFQCHGPDANARQAELRLDQRTDAVADRGGFAAIVPGDAAASELIERISATDSDVVMPPPGTNKSLTSDQRQMLREWIEQGAQYEEHWSFLPIADPRPPRVEQASWVHNDIDRFILARLEEGGLRPSPPADRGTLVRRLYLDLLGLLPPPAVVEKFVASRDPDSAYRTLVNQLLESEHYGERWGRHWLDQARYADSNGYTIDGDRIMWPYRDWVIKALNDDMPFDQFTIEQLAGDLLQRPTKSQLVASGFHRNTLINQEGGTDDEQFRNEEVVDRVNTTGAVWLGLTLGCAQCHSHKFDPVTQKEYYQLFAFFNQTEDVNNTGPTVSVSENELLVELSNQSRERIESAKSRITDLERSQKSRQASWEKRLTSSAVRDEVTWKQLRAERLSNSDGPALRELPDGSILAARGSGSQFYVVSYRVPPGPIAAVRLRVLPHASLPKTGPGLANNGNFILTDFKIQLDDRPLAVVAARASHAQPGFPIEQAVDADLGTGWAINVAKGSPKKMNAPHEAHFVLAERVESSAGELSVTLRHQGNSKHYNIGRFAIDIAADPPPVALSALLREALRTPVDRRTKEQRTLLRQEFAAADGELLAARQQLAEVKRELGMGTLVKTMVMRQRSKPRDTFLHIRGDFLRPDEQLGVLQANVPAVFPPLPTGPRQATRLDLARWLVQADHPLTARVAVNRIWLRYFGRGLVETENDFGTQGAYPTHPELLDWLASRFIENGWSMKSMHRLIVHSSTYRQSSTARSDLAAIDPRNEWLGRQNRLRVDAEIVRDAALSASDLLERRIGGPSVRPPQPDGVYAFTQQKKKWITDTGANRYRRTMYTFFYRSAPYPLLTTFDAPDFQSVCTARARSNTPLQSLTMANDQAMFELARGLGFRLLREVPDADRTVNGDQIRQKRAERAFLICYSRKPSDAEIKPLIQFQQRMQSRFESDQAAAALVSGNHDRFNPAEAAAWTCVARVLMNTDEFITRE